ncbi:MAG TPA: hypothetical protein VMH81_36000 [Bryobacteraceae bacterium]|nr:hypothetical protein [Bryobacteraceae bacterium]
MKHQFWVACGIGIACVGLVVAGVLFMQRGARVGLTGSVLKVRTAPLDDNSSVVVLDFRINNPGNVLFVVRGVTVVLEEKDGKQFDGQTVAEMDAKRLFEGLPLLGPKYTDTLVERDRVPGHTSQDRMVAARFNAPESRLEGRKRFLLRIEEVDGLVSEITER